MSGFGDHHPKAAILVLNRSGLFACYPLTGRTAAYRDWTPESGRSAFV
jgi:hypothetical protein